MATAGRAATGGQFPAESRDHVLARYPGGRMRRVRRTARRGEARVVLPIAEDSGAA